jgi:hypothetical protein
MYQFKARKLVKLSIKKQDTRSLDFFGSGFCLGLSQPCAYIRPRRLGGRAMSVLLWNPIPMG